MDSTPTDCTSTRSLSLLVKNIERVTEYAIDVKKPLEHQTHPGAHRNFIVLECVASDGKSFKIRKAEVRRNKHKIVEHLLEQLDADGFPKTGSALHQLIALYNGRRPADLIGQHIAVIVSSDGDYIAVS